MRSLYLSDNKLTSLEPVSGLTKIWSLYVDGNQVTDLQPLAKLKWLSSLDVRGNGVEDLKPLADLTELRHLFLENNKVADLSILVSMAEKDATGEQRFAPFWNLYLANNPLDEAKSKPQLDRLKELGARLHMEPIAK